MIFSASVRRAMGIVLAIALASCLLTSETQAAGSLSTQLGSPSWMPTPDNPVGWRGDGTGRYPGANPPTTWSRKKNGGTYETTNILWMSRLPNKSVATPIIVGDNIFLTSESCDLVCLEKKTGKVLWIRSNEEAETIGADDRQSNPAYAQTVDPLVKQLAPLNDEAVAALNAGDEQRISRVLKNKEDLDKHLTDALKAIDQKRFERYWAQGAFGFAGCTPTSDGKHVGVFFTTGVTACYDLAGKRQWIDRGKGGCSEHGNFASPVLLSNTLVVWAAELRGYNIATGKIAFNNPGRSENTYGSMFRFRCGDDWVAAFQSGYFTRVRDGKPIFGDMAFGNSISTPIVEGNTIYAWVGYPRNSQGLGFKAFMIPASTEEKSLKAAYTFKIDWASDELPETKATPFDRSYTASPLFVDGLIYQLTEGGGLTVNDAATGEPVYKKILDMKPFTEYWAWAGASASPTLAGKYIYLMDNQGTTVVIKPGKEYVEVARNFLEEGADGNHYAQNLATPVFEGTRLYYRTPGYLYCIGQ